MPETAVDEDDGTILGQHEIRLSWKSFRMEAVPEAQSVQLVSQKHFRPGILASNARRHPGPVLPTMSAMASVYSAPIRAGRTAKRPEDE